MGVSHEASQSKEISNTGELVQMLLVPVSTVMQCGNKPAALRGSTLCVVRYRKKVEKLQHTELRTNLVLFNVPKPAGR